MSSQAPENTQSAALQRSQAYLAETQRLTRTGSFAIEATTQAVTYSSAEHSRLYGFDPADGLPSIADFFDRIHPDDREMCSEAMSRGLRDMTDVEVEYRVLIPGSPPRIIHAFGHPVPGASGESTEIVGTIVDVTERREAEAQTAQVAEEQAALRRVATLVATEAPPAEVFRKVAEEAARVIGDVDISLWRDEGDGTATIVAACGNVMAPGTRLATDGNGVIATVLREGRPYWTADNRNAGGAIVEAALKLGITGGIGSPILMGGRVWGALGASPAGGEVLAPGTEAQLEQFGELVATAIANAQARTEVERLADEQAALRRVATLVARGTGPEAVCQAVAEEARALLDCDNAAVVRFGTDGLVTLMGASNTSRQTGARLRPDPRYVVAAVLETGRAARFDTDDPLAPGLPDAVRAEGIRTALASPIVVDGELWGTMTVGKTGDEALPPEAEPRLQKLAELIATAVGNAESREALGRLAEERAALQRVATLVARGVEPAELFAAVSREVSHMFGSDMAAVGRFDPDGPALVVAGLAQAFAGVTVGTRWPLHEKMSATQVYRTGRSARVDTTDWSGVDEPIGVVARELRTVSTASSPVVVEGRLWGAITVTANEPLPRDAEQRLEKFTELIATAIANADGRDQLNASRARLLTTADEARRRVVRDLHDGAQQRLVHGIVSLNLVRQALEDDNRELRSLVDEALEQVELGNAELRELAHGILPANLTRSGLRAAIGTVVSRLNLPVRLDVPDQRFPAEVEASAYFTVAEALTNVLKHAEATSAEVTVSATHEALRIEVRDDGVGGADPDAAGLLGLQDRAAALGGALTIQSPVGGGTVLAATLPLTRE